MTEIERLILSVESKGVSQVNKELDSVDKATKNVKSSNSELHSSYLVIAAAVAVVATGVAFLGKKLIDATSTYQRFNAMLTTATGSADKAAQAYDALVDFGVKTPFSVNEAIQAFIDLQNLGLKPSEKALRSYGDTASATGHSMLELVDAVTRGSVDEFKSLRTFGIATANLGDQIAFTFRNATTLVKNDSKSIEAYMIGLGEKFFGGSMERQMNTLGGAISNIGDALDKFWVNVAKQGPDTVLFKAVTALTDGLDTLNAELASGQTLQVVKAYGILWSGTTSAIKNEFGDLTDFILKELNLVTSGNDRTWSTMAVQATSGIELMAVRLQELFTVDAVRDFTAFGQLFANQFNSLVELAKVSGEEILSFLTGGISGDVNFSAEVARIQKEAEARKLAILQERNLKKDENDKFQAETEASIVAETESRIQAFKDYLAQAAILRQDYDNKILARQKAGGDRLADLTGGGPQTDFGKLDKTEIEGAKDVAKGLVGEGHVLLDSWQGTMDKLVEITSDTMEKRKAAILTAIDQVAVTEKDKILLEYEARKNYILSATELTEKVKTDLMKRLTNEREAQITQIELKNQKVRLDQAESFFGNIASIGSTFGKKGFEIAKAAAIAQATIKTYEAATSAYASLSGIPYIGPALGAAAAAAAIVAGAANIAQIKAQQYTPATYAQGGMIPAGRYGIVGEAGPELVAGPAIVTNASQTANKLGQGGVRTVTVQNWGGPVEASSSMDGDELLIMLKPILAEHKKEVKGELTSEVTRGGSDFARGMEGTYGLQRGGGQH